MSPQYSVRISSLIVRCGLWKNMIVKRRCWSDAYEVDIRLSLSQRPLVKIEMEFKVRLNVKVRAIVDRIYILAFPLNLTLSRREGKPVPCTWNLMKIT